MKIIFTYAKAMASSQLMQCVGEDGKKMWSRYESGCAASHMCTPGVYDVYGVRWASLEALEFSLSFGRCQEPADCRGKQKNATDSDSITRCQTRRHVMDVIVVHFHAEGRDGTQMNEMSCMCSDNERDCWTDQLAIDQTTDASCPVT